MLCDGIFECRAQSQIFQAPSSALRVSSISPASHAALIRHLMRAAFSKGARCRERLAAVFTAVSGEWAERFGACVRCFGPRLAIAILFVVANAIFGCSAQHAPQYQYSSPATYRSYSPVPPGSRVEVASWYGPGFAGHSTSTGETFNPNELTAASRRYLSVRACEL